MDRRRSSATNWQDYENNLLNKIAFTGNAIQPESIHKFVQNAIKNSLRSQPDLQALLPKELEYDLFETHRSLFVRFRLPAAFSLKNIRLWANQSKLRVDYSGTSEEIALPAEANTQRIIARVRDGILEVRMPKSTEPDPFREIFIRE